MVVYDSVFGNTEKIALAISSALGSEGSVGTFRVSEIKPEQLVGLSLLLVGSPTRAFRPTKEMVSFLNMIPADGLKGVKVAAFDTRISEANSRIMNVLVKFLGYAAQPLAALLVKRGGSQLIPPEGFYVKDSGGPLLDGELERAAAWAGQLLKAL